jgi:hypothetical protein
MTRTSNAAKDEEKLGHSYTAGKKIKWHNHSWAW